MSRRLYPHTRIRYWYAYDVEDICTVFADKKLHPQTVRKWIKAGLKTIDSSKPTLVYGYNLIQFLKNNNSKNKCQTSFEEFYCLKCQDARPVYRNRIIAEQNQGYIKAKAHCRTCKSRMNKSYKLIDFPKLRKAFQLAEVLELSDSAPCPANTHLEHQKKQPESESLQWSLF